MLNTLASENARGVDMQDIRDWLKSRIPELVSFQKDASEKSDFQLEAKALWLKAEAAGYSVAELKQACEGDIEKYLLDLQKGYRGRSAADRAGDQSGMGGSFSSRPSISSRREHIPQEEVFFLDREGRGPVSPTPTSPEEKARLQREVLQKELDLLRARLAIIRSQVGVVTKSGTVWVHASARSQLGAYPWAKFGALVAGSYFLTRGLRNLPFSSITAAAIPLATMLVKRTVR
ncbi:hypothetical protein P6U16_26085 (plasmid) [Rhizobium sp. 32-5/1]|uniref:hypothetical protein n=1 Tax=Rhizobium sp. 32-5/1 TaxID=3019602 RepID=UPI00240E79C8|nr:hypothetical protein [Rhizobium sp. 32-5/1]WEZ85529.1 hypothetical protein P6U16_26085 [Rhizobium sp. 32-5/1]